MKQKLKQNKYVGIALIIICVLALLFIIPFFVPMLTQLFAGNAIINNHIEKAYISDSLSGHINDSFKWLNDTYIPYGEDRVFPLYGLKNGFYKVNKKTVMFIRPTTISWFILMKTGNCGEHADYLYAIFKRLGYDVREVRAAGGDHAIIQVVDNDTFYFIDPSAPRILNHSTYFENGQWGRILATTTNGTELDLTNEIISNKTNVSLKKNTTQRVKVAIKSTYLMSNNGMYKKPLLVYQFKSVNDSIIISSGVKYLIENYRDFGLFKFSIETDTDMSRDTIIYSQDVPITFGNFKITTIGYIILLVLCAIVLYFNIKWVIKSLRNLISNYK